MSHGETDPTELVRFAKQVQAMRAAQRAYFKHRTPVYLKTATELESKVDKSLKWILKHREAVQPSLFNDPPEVSGKGPYGGAI